MIKSIVRKIIALIEIVILMMANFVLIFSNTITYALEDIDQDASTNNKNVEFIAYFKTENEKKTYNKQDKLRYLNEFDTNLNLLKVHIRLSYKYKYISLQNYHT